MKRFKTVITVMILTALALSVARPASAKAAIEAPSKVVAYLGGTDIPGSISFEVRGMKMSEQIKIAQVKSSNKELATIDSLYARYYSAADKAKDSYCRINISAKKAGTVNIKYNVGKASKTTKLVIKDYENPVKKITLTGVNDGKDFSSMTAKSSQVFGEWDEETGKNTSAFTIKAVENPVLHIEPASGWYITEVSANLDDNTYEDYYKYTGKKYNGAQDFTLYKLTENTRSLTVYFVNKDGGKMEIYYTLKPW